MPEPPAMFPTIPNVAPSLFRAGYHAWRYVQACSSQGANSLSPAQEAAELTSAFKEADDLLAATGAYDAGIEKAREFLGRRDTSAKVANGMKPDLFRSTDRLLRNEAAKPFWSWWVAGCNVSALELMPGDASGEDRDAAFQDLKGALAGGGVTREEVEGLLTGNHSQIPTKIRAWLDKFTIEQGNLDLQRLRAQHQSGMFPEEALLAKLGCTPAGIKLLRLLFNERPEPVRNSRAAKQFHVTVNAITQRYGALPDVVRTTLLVRDERNRLKSWRMPETHS